MLHTTVGPDVSRGKGHEGKEEENNSFHDEKMSGVCWEMINKQSPNKV